jgi:hypothetical protein
MVETEPAAIGPHAGGLEPILRVRDSKQLFSPVGWNLFCVAHRRLGGILFLECRMYV